MTRLGIKKCNNCGRYSHQEGTCWNKPENAHLRPEGWQGPYHYAGFPKAAETGNVSLDQWQVSDHDLVQTIDKVSLAYTTGECNSLYTK